MAQEKIVVATPHSRYDRLEDVLRTVHGFNVFRVRKPGELSVDQLQTIAPAYVFFPHWSWLIPKSIHDAFECVVFHMTDLPFGRGGSPLQNLIVRGIRETRLSAIRCTETLDAGPVYLKKPLSLEGSAEEIFVRAAQVMEGMIDEIVMNRIVPQPQIGEPTVFQRRRPAEGNIAKLDSIASIHDHIRMLDAEGYPRAFLEAGNLRLEFECSRLLNDRLVADVRISLITGEKKT